MRCDGLSHMVRWHSFIERPLLTYGNRLLGFEYTTVILVCENFPVYYQVEAFGLSED